jgi:hypothetical protein
LSYSRLMCYGGGVFQKGSHPKLRKSRMGFAHNNDPPQPN